MLLMRRVFALPPALYWWRVLLATHNIFVNQQSAHSF
jgi:hypothetical protein